MVMTVEERKEKKRLYDIKYKAENKERDKLVAAKWRKKNEDRVKAVAAKWREDNKERRSVVAAEFYKKNKEAINLVQTAYRKNNPDAVKATQLKYYNANKSKTKATKLKYYNANKAKFSAKSANRRALKFGATIYMTKEDKAKIAELYKIAKDATKLFGYTWEVDHIVPLNKGGLHKLSNLQVVPMTWNRSKGDKNCDTYWD